MSSGVPIFDRATGRVVAVIVLLMAVAASLRGYLPGVERVDRRPPHNGASLVYIAAMLVVSLLILAVACIARLRDPRRTVSSATPLADRFSSGNGRPAWWVMLIGAATLVVWLLLLWVLSRYIGPHHIDQPQSPSTSRPSTVPPATATAPPQPPSQDGESDGDMLRLLTAGTVALILLIIAGTVLSRRRRSGDLPAGSSSLLADSAPVTPAVASLVRAAESGLAEIENPDREPRQAIIACYTAMERELRRFPGAAPQDFDTPTEVMARAVEHHALRADTAIELVSLFEEARFSPHVMTETHRSRAVDVLQLVLADMGSPV